MNKTVIYARFSSDRQTEVSIDAQVRACTEYAVNHGLQISKIYKDEAISGTTAARAGYQELLEDAMMDKFDTVLIHKYDRISRDMSEQAILDRKFRALNIQLIAVAQDFGDTKDGRLTKGITWALAEYYSANLSEEVRKGLKESALKALHCGGVSPFGYDVVNKQLVPNEIEADFVRRMFEICVSGEKFTGIIEEMSALGITGKRGKPIGRSQIYEILRNEKYTGTFVYSPVEETDRVLRRTKPNAIRVENAFPAIVSRNLFEQAQQVLDGRKCGKRDPNPLSGLIVCSCGHKMHRFTSSSKGHKYIYYRCPDCRRNIKEEVLTGAVETYMDDLFTEETIRRIEKIIDNLDLDQKRRQKDFNKAKKGKLEELNNDIRQLLEALAKGKFNDNYEIVDSMITEKRKAIEALEEAVCPVISDFTMKKWLDDLHNNRRSPKQFIKYIQITETSIEIFSRFAEENEKDSTPFEMLLNPLVAEERLRLIQQRFDRRFIAI